MGNLQNTFYDLKEILFGSIHSFINFTQSTFEEPRYTFLSANEIKDTYDDGQRPSHLKNTHLFLVASSHQEGESTVHVLEQKSCCGNVELKKETSRGVCCNAHKARFDAVNRGKSVCGQCMATLYADKP